MNEIELDTFSTTHNRATKARRKGPRPYGTFFLSAFGKTSFKPRRWPKYYAALRQKERATRMNIKNQYNN